MSTSVGIWSMVLVDTIKSLGRKGNAIIFRINVASSGFLL